MKYKNISMMLILIGLFSILSLNVFATPTWWTEGNEGARYGQGGNYWLYASPFVNDADNIDFTTYTFTQTHNNLIISNILNDFGSTNHFYFYSGTQVYYMDIEGGIIDSYTFAENVERVDVINLDSDSSLELLVKHGDYLTALTLDANFRFSFVRSWDLVTNYNPKSYAVDFTNNLVFYVNGNFQTIYKIDLETGVTYSYTEETIYYSSYALGELNYPILKVDTQYYLYMFYPYNVAGGNTKRAYAVKFDYYGGSFDYVDSSTISSSIQQIQEINDLEIFYIDDFYFRVLNKISNSPAYVNRLVDSDLNIVSNDLTYKIFVGDANKDGKNEVCSNYGTYLECLNSLGDVEFIIELIDVHSINTEISLGNYNNDSDYMNIITPCHIYELVYINDSYYNTSNIYDLSLSCSDTDAKIYPVGMYDKQTFIKDLIVTDNDQLFYMYISGGADSVCGDGVCDIGETIVNCPSDCLDVETDYTFNIKNVVINPSINAIIKNGSRLKINYDVVPSDVNLKYQTQTSISYNDGVNYTSIDGWSNINTQTQSFSHDTYLNQLTETGKIKIEVRIFGQSTLESKIYDFVVRDNGIEYGEVVYSEVTSQEELARDNVLYNTFVFLGSTLNMSAFVLYLLTCVIIVGGIIYSTREMNFNHVLTSIFVFYSMLVVGALSKIVPTSIILTITIIGLIVLGVGFKNHLAGARN